MFGGNYSFYIDTIEQEEAQRAAAEASARTSKAKVDRAAPKPAPAAKPAPSNSKYNHLSVEQLESLVIDREERLAGLNARFADPAIFRDPGALGQLKAEIDAARVELAEIDAAWHERAAD